MAKIWKLKIPPRVMVFGWLTLRNRILTMDNLRRRGMIVVYAYPMCLSEEWLTIFSQMHFCLGDVSAVIDWFGCSWVSPRSISDVF